MIRSTDYHYVNEDSINSLLKCPLCSKPFVDPVIITDGNRVCRACISSDDDNYQHLIPVKEKLLLAMLDDLRIECIKCKQSNIRRGDLEEHNNTTCPKRMISCKAADLKCSWTGVYEQVNHHLESCVFESLRPILTEILIQNREQQQEIQKLKEQQLTFTCEHEKEVQVLREQVTRLQTENERFENQILIFQQEINHTKQLYNQQITYNNELQQLKKQNTLYQSQKDEILHTKQLCNQHDIQIKLLARKKCVIPSKSSTKEEQTH
jgi:myosin heavy subunit